jgi:outer membrane protein assembly factor BamB
MTWRRTLTCIALLTVLSAPGICEDWPQFRGMNRDGKSTETGLLKEWPAEGLEPVWVFDGLGKGYSGVAVAAGVVYVAGMIGEANEGVLFAFDLPGNLKWQTPYGPEWNVDKYVGTRSTPTVDGERIYFMSGHGVLICFAAETGAILWSVDVAKQFKGTPPMCGFAEGVLVDGDRVVCTPGGGDAAVVALDKNTGATVWTSKGLSEMSAYCSPILVARGGKRAVVTMTAMSVVGINADTGAVLWKVPQDADEKDQNHAVSPLYENGRVYVTSGHGDGGRMIAVAPDGLSATEAWADETLNTGHEGLVLNDGYIYGTNSKGKWVCLSLDSGEVKYEERGVGRGSVAYADGMLYCYGEKGTLGIVKASPAGHEVVSSFKVTQGDGPHWSHPVISGGRLYIRHGAFLMVYDVKSDEALMTCRSSLQDTHRLHCHTMPSSSAASGPAQ